MCKLFFANKLKGIDLTILEKLANNMEYGQKDGTGLILETEKDCFYLKADNFKELEQTLLGYKVCNLLKTACLISDPITNIKTKVDLSKVHTIAMHTRTSTNCLGPEYAHPFHIGSNLFMHNGIVQVPDQHKYPTETDNDSEYLGYVFNYDFNKLNEVSGYYAFINYNLKQKVWKIGRDSTASLFLSKHSKDGLCIATSESDIQNFQNIFKVKSGKFRIKPFTMLQIGQKNVQVHDLARPKAKAIIDQTLMRKSMGVHYPAPQFMGKK